VDGLKAMNITMRFTENSQEAKSGNVKVAAVDWTNVSIGSEIDGDERQKLEKLLKKYQELFGKVIPGAARDVEHFIEVTDDIPVVCWGKRVPLVDQELIEKHVEEMLREGVISHSRSAYRSPVVLATKKDGKKRFCVNYRKLNEKTIKNRHPLPHIEDLIDRTAGSKYFCVLDLSSAYWQVPLAKRDRPKTAFSTGSGHYEFNVMPFGLCNAPATQQEFMKRTLKGLQGADVLLDDVIIHGVDKETTLLRLEAVFNRLLEQNLRLKLEKCKFLMESVKYLGYLISGSGRAVDPDKTKAIEGFPVPKSVQELKSFLGLTAYCKRFVKGFATTASPLYELTKKTNPWMWTQQCQNAFEKIKKALINPPVLAVPNVQLPYTLYTDASEIGMGATLCQQSEVDQREHVIAYGSQHFNVRERKYSTIEKEAAAIVWAIDYFRPYLKGARFTIRSDHAPLRWLANRQDATGRLGRWQTRIMECVGLQGIEYLRGSDNSVADGLSRMPEILVLHPEEEVIKTDQLKQMQESDQQFDSRKMILERGVWLMDGKIFVPGNLRERLLKSYHGNGVHFGVGRTLDLVGHHFYWAGMRKDVTKTVSSCDICQRAKKTPGPIEKPSSMKMTERPFQRISMDYAGPLKRTRRGNQYFLVVVDDFSRYIKVFPVVKANGATTIRCLRQVFAEEGVPEEVLTDNGTHFTSGDVDDFLRARGVNHVKSPAYHPASNGMAERSVSRTIKMLIRANILDKGGEWDCNLDEFQFKYNAAVHPSTGEIPFSIVRGRTPMMSAASSWLKAHTKVFQVNPSWREVVRYSSERKRNENFGDVKSKEFHVGDRVWAWSTIRKQWDGPYQIVELIGSRICRLRNGDVRHYDHLLQEKQ
jgi:hypothetical protein